MPERRCEDRHCSEDIAVIKETVNTIKDDFRHNKKTLTTRIEKQDGIIMDIKCVLASLISAAATTNRLLVGAGVIAGIIGVVAGVVFGVLKYLD